MFTALRDLPDPAAADVVVVGSGPAGLVLARRLAERGADVLLLESGGAQAGYDARSTVEETGLPFPGARDGRARGFGGTGQKWAGQCLPLDPIDLAARPWVDHSGWPLSAADLEPWYGEACAAFRLSGPPRHDARDLTGLAVGLPAFDPAGLRWRVLHFSPEPHLGTQLRGDFAADPRVRVVLDATVARVDVSAGRAVGVTVRSPGGGERGLRARHTVLACGAIENARLLLLSLPDAAARAEDGWLGRGLQDHPFWDVAEIERPEPALASVFATARVPGSRVRAKLALSDGRQAELGTLNAVANVDLAHGPRSAVGALKRLVDAGRARRLPAHPGAELRALAGDPGALARELRSRRRGVGAPPDRDTRLMLRVQTEQPPRAESRVTLSARRDALGVPLPRVHWTVGEAERHTCEAVAGEVAGQFAALGLGQVRPVPWLGDLAAFRAGARDFYHHAGTTRMSVAPADGVVDPDGAVHGVGGLSVAGGSVFPTSGYANPTLTIVALALRLAEHLAGGVAA